MAQMNMNLSRQSWTQDRPRDRDVNKKPDRGRDGAARHATATGATAMLLAPAAHTGNLTREERHD